jgi:hypothetical protein
MEKDTLRMQMLSGVITEGEYKLRLNEQTDTNKIRNGKTYRPSNQQPIYF